MAAALFICSLPLIDAFLQVMSGTTKSVATWTGRFVLVFTRPGPQPGFIAAGVDAGANPGRIRGHDRRVLVARPNTEARNFLRTAASSLAVRRRSSPATRPR